MFFLVPVLGVFCFKSPTFPQPLRPRVEVKSPVTQDATWSSGNDYIVHGQVTVEENALITIEKDVHIYKIFKGLI